MQPGTEKLLTIVRSAWRFRWAALACAWAVALAGWAVVLLLPGRFDTEAQIYVNTTSLLQPLLQGLTVAPNTANQIELVRQAIVGRPQLERVVESSGLRKRYRNESQKQALLTDLSQKIRIRGDLQSRNFSITYSDPDPKISYSVVQSLLGSFVNESVQANQSDSEAAQQFLLKQIAEYDARLTDSEKRLAEFKRSNIGAMPDDRGGYFERLQSEMRELDRLNAILAVATRKRDELRGRLTGNAGTSQSAATITTSVDVQLADARAKLQDLRLRYTEAYPDVVALKEVIANLEMQRRTEIESFRSNTESLGTPRANSTSLVTQNLQIGLNDVELEIATTGAQVADHQHRVNELKSSINTLPEVEAELTRLNRDYGINKAQYDALVQRLESARLSQKSQNPQDVVFKIVNPPVLPLQPASPDRPLLSVAVLCVAIGAGGALAYLLALLRPTYMRASELQAAIGTIPVIGSVAGIRSARVISSHRRGLVLFGSLSGFLVAALGAVVVVSMHWESLRPMIFARGGA